MNAPPASPVRPTPAVRVVIVFTAITLWWLLLVPGISAVTGEDYTRGLHLVRAVAATAFTVPLVMLAARYLDRRPRQDIVASSRRNSLRHLVFGALCWLVPAAAVGAVVVAAGWVRIEVSASPVDIVAGLALLIVSVNATPVSAPPE